MNVARFAHGALAVGLLALCAGCAHSALEGDALLSEETARLRHAIEEVRGLTLSHDVPSRLIHADEVPAVVRRALLADASPEELAATQEALVTLGLWPEGRDLLSSYVAVTGEAGGGFYLPHERTLYVVADAPLGSRVFAGLGGRDVAREMVLAHELVHALQHEHHPFWFEHGALLRSHADAASALQAALEGDATLYGFLAVDLPPPDPARFRGGLEAGMSPQGGGALAVAPPLLRASLLFPYANGYALAWREGKELLASPPASTEQVLHPERRHEAFEAIDLAAGRDALPRGCRLVDENTAGELELSLLLTDLAPDVPPAAWIGWDGDRYLAARCDDRRELVWLTLWDSERDAAEFADAYSRAAPAVAERARFSGPPTVTQHTREVWIASPGLEASAGAIFAHARRARVATPEALAAHFGDREPGVDEPAQAGASGAAGGRGW